MSWRSMIPRGSIQTAIMELGPKRPSLLWFVGSKSEYQHLRTLLDKGLVRIEAGFILSSGF